MDARIDLQKLSHDLEVSDMLDELLGDGAAERGRGFAGGFLAAGLKQGAKAPVGISQRFLASGGKVGAKGPDTFLRRFLAAGGKAGAKATGAAR